MCVWVRVLPALPFFLGWVLGRVAPCARRVRVPPPSCGAACGVGVFGGCCGWDLSPPSPPFFFGLRGGGCFRSCRVAAWWCPPLPVPILGLLVSAPPSSFVWAAPMFFFLPVTSPVRCVPACPACPFLRWAAALGWVSPCLAGRSSGVLSGGPLWVSPSLLLGWGFARLFWTGCVASRLCVCLLPPPPFFSSVLFVCFLFFFFGGGVPVPPSAFAELVHALVAIRCGSPGCCWCFCLAGPCPCPRGPAGYVHAWPGGLSYRVRFWLCRLGGSARRFLEVLG